MPAQNLPAGEPKDMKKLAAALPALTNSELDDKLMLDGGILMSEERFRTFCDEYHRRKYSLPQ